MHRQWTKFNKLQKRLTTGGVITLAALAVSLLFACSATATTAASCAYVIGNTKSDASLHKVVYPGQAVVMDTSTERVEYIPCNSRNYIINDGTVFSPNVNPKTGKQEQVGDRFTLIKATTKNGTWITIGVSAYWTPNQAEKALRDFYTVCFKYTCASKGDVGGDANFSSPGWNGMLAENFGYALDRAARTAAYQVDDSIWETNNPEQYKTLGEAMSRTFSSEVLAPLGFSEDLFCGSGNSEWSNPKEPGKGKFNCTPVRIVIDDVKLMPNQGDLNPAGSKALNAKRLENATVVYGAEASHWLAVQDTVVLCKSAGVVCVFNMDSTGAGVAVPVNRSVPQTQPAPTPVQPSRN